MTTQRKTLAKRRTLQLVRPPPERAAALLGQCLALRRADRHLLARNAALHAEMRALRAEISDLVDRMHDMQLALEQVGRDG